MAADDAAKLLKTSIREKAIAGGRYGVSPWILTNTTEQNGYWAQPPVTRACRLLRHELLPYHYEYNVALIVFEHHLEWVLQKMKQWLSAISVESRKKIQSAYLLSEGEIISSRRYPWVGDMEEARAFFYGDVAVEIGSPILLSNTPKAFQAYYDYLGESTYQYKWARKITFQ